MKIGFNYLNVNRKFNHSAEARNLIGYILEKEGKSLGEISIIFTNNAEILHINKCYLKHDFYTDVITFVNNHRNTISGDIYISIDQVILNSSKYKTDRLEELFRVIIHGVLHLIGYVDENELDRKRMSVKEDLYLCFLKEDTKLGKDELVL